MSVAEYRLEWTYGMLKQYIIDYAKENFGIEFGVDVESEWRAAEGANYVPNHFFYRGERVEIYENSDLSKLLTRGSSDKQIEDLDNVHKIIWDCIVESRLRSVLQKEAESRGQFTFEKDHNLIAILKSRNTDLKEELLELSENPGYMKDALDKFFTRTYGKKITKNTLPENSYQENVVELKLAA